MLSNSSPAFFEKPGYFLRAPRTKKTPATKMARAKRVIDPDKPGGCLRLGLCDPVRCRLYTRPNREGSRFDACRVNTLRPMPTWQRLAIPCGFAGCIVPPRTCADKWGTAIGEPRIVRIRRMTLRQDNRQSPFPATRPANRRLQTPKPDPQSPADAVRARRRAAEGCRAATLLLCGGVARGMAGL